MAVPPSAIGAIAPTQPLSLSNLLPATTSAQPAGHASFAQMLLDGIASVNHRVANADAMVRAFTVDDSIPLHQVTFALEEARLSMELMMQVRARLVESYQRMMEMQL